MYINVKICKVLDYTNDTNYISPSIIKPLQVNMLCLSVYIFSLDKDVEPSRSGIKQQKVAAARLLCSSSSSTEAGRMPTLYRYSDGPGARLTNCMRGGVIYMSHVSNEALTGVWLHHRHGGAAVRTTER